MSEIKPCPYCRSEIAEAAIKCPVCQSSLAKKTPLQRLLGLRDYVTFPTAVLALVAAVYTPLVAPVRAFLGLDGANVEAFFLSPEMLAADKPDAERPAMRMSEGVEWALHSCSLLARLEDGACSIR